MKNSDSFPNNNFCFTEDDFIESINNINDATRHRDNYNFTWNKIKDLEGVEYIYNTAHKDGPITWKVVPGCDEDMFEDQRKEGVKKIDDLCSPIVDEEGDLVSVGYKYNKKSSYLHHEKTSWINKT